MEMKFKKIGAWIGIAILGVFALFIALYATADISLKERVAQVAGTIIGNKWAEDESFGSALGNTFEQQVRMNENYVVGGDVYSASSTLFIARALTAGEVCNNRVITVNGTATAALSKTEASLDLTLPATSTLFAECLKTNGDQITFDFVNQSPTAASTTEFVAGTGCQLVNGVADGDSTIPGQKGATVTIKRIKDWLADGGTKDCVVWVYEWN